MSEYLEMIDFTFDAAAKYAEHRRRWELPTEKDATEYAALLDAEFGLKEDNSPITHNNIIEADGCTVTLCFEMDWDSSGAGDAAILGSFCTILDHIYDIMAETDTDEATKIAWHQYQRVSDGE